MYKRVVIPLDGSKLAEEALNHLDEVADCTDIMLISVTEKIDGVIPEKQIFEPFVSEHEQFEPPPMYTATQMGVNPLGVSPSLKNKSLTGITAGKMARTANDYLYQIGEALADRGFDVTTDVLMGDPPKEIVRYAQEQKADIILLAAQGKKSFSRWNTENVAEKVSKMSKIPVMLVKPPAGFKETKPKRKGVAM